MPGEFVNRSRQRSPNLSAGDRILAGLLALLVRPTRLLRSAIALKPSEVYPAFSPDGKFLFWGSERSSFEIPTKRLDRAQIDRLWNTPFNGRGNIFFISSDVLADSSNAQP